MLQFSIASSHEFIRVKTGERTIKRSALGLNALNAVPTSRAFCHVCVSKSSCF